ncbi:hypothetical protein PV327_010000 [Microctonus hyperodae]|uniref:Uncharacterized protein n=1 Tax=Microctonus hyperodae TaxID=165561 RepID=A0AA39F253_MICHY|nr:hypothetical protein PV327_010000 [Microctonus hyperodae]
MAVPRSEPQSSRVEEGQPVLEGEITAHYASSIKATAAPQDRALLPGHQVLPSPGAVGLYYEGPQTTRPSDSSCSTQMAPSAKRCPGGLHSRVLQGRRTRNPFLRHYHPRPNTEPTHVVERLFFPVHKGGA